MTTRLALALALGLFLAAAPASAQWDGASYASPAADGSFQLEDHADRDSATEQHRVGSALVATGLTLNVLGAIGSLAAAVNMMASEEPVCARGFSSCSSGPTFDWDTFFFSSILTAGVGLVAFFVGLGLDVHAHVMRDAAPRLAMTPSGIALVF